MLRPKPKNIAESDDYVHEGFVLAGVRDEARVQLWTSAAVCALILAALLAAALVGTA